MTFARSAILAIGILGLAQAAAQELVTLEPRAGIKQSYLLDIPDSGKPQAIVVLFPGGGGSIRLRLEQDQIKFSPGNFLVRSRRHFVEHGIAAAVVDAPSDQAGGMSDGFRSGDKHAADIAAVTADLKRRLPGVPVYFVGTSRGTVSAAYAATRVEGLAGVVLSSSLFNASRAGEAGLSGFDYSKLKVPLLFVHHVDDACRFTPYHTAKRLSDSYPLISVRGGKPPTSDPCEAFSAHGFLGKESETVDAMAKWMLKQPYPKEVE